MCVVITCKDELANCPSTIVSYIKYVTLHSQRDETVYGLSIMKEDHFPFINIWKHIRSLLKYIDLLISIKMIIQMTRAIQ